MNDSRIASSCQPAIKTTHLGAAREALLLLAAGVCLTHGALESVGREVRIDLRRGQARMPQQLLNRAQIRAALDAVTLSSLTAADAGDEYVI